MKKGTKLRDFNLHDLKQLDWKEYKYLLLLLYVPVYLIGFLIIELLVPETADYWSSWCIIDDWIPFNEWFVIPYYFWYPLLFIVGIWLMVKDVPNFKLYMYCIMIGFSFSILFCLIFPNGQDLRPEVFPRDNVLTDMVKAIYAVDTNTNVLPSVHAVGAIVAAFGVCTTDTVRSWWIKAASVFGAALICMATCFIKQHSILDVFAAMALCAVIYVIVYVYIRRAVSGEGGQKEKSHKGVKGRYAEQD